ncbi:hypothetical protein ACVWZ8_003851 [Arthrobacter sp. UYCu723]
MIENDFLRWGLTALLLAASLYAAFRASRKSPAATRVGFGLHAAMMTAMVLMLPPGSSGPHSPRSSSSAWPRGGSSSAPSPGCLCHSQGRGTVDFRDETASVVCSTTR